MQNRKSNVYISSEAKALIKKYFKPCNLDEEVLNWINQLPEIFTRKLVKELLDIY